MKHTQLPWSVDHYDEWVSFASPEHPDAYFMRTDFDGCPPNVISANAEYIVKACNAFPELVKTLKDIRENILEPDKIQCILDRARMKVGGI